MTRIAYLWIIGGAACACAIAVVCWYFASIYGTSKRKGKALFAAALFGGSGLCIAVLTLLLYQRYLPVFEFEGNIEAASVHRGKRDRTDVLIHTSLGGDIALHADGVSPYFRRDEHVKVRYQGETGMILRARFVSADGRDEGAFNDTGPWSLLLVLLLGVMIIVQGFRRYRRDPEGAEERSVPDRNTTIDRRSLLNLSEEVSSEPELDDEPK